MSALKTTLAAALATLAMNSAAFAGIYTYDAYVGNGIGDVTLAIDSDAGTAQYTGENIDLTLTSQYLRGFSGISTTTGVYHADDVTGTFTRNGITYDAFHSTNPKHTQLHLSDVSNFLWTFGTDAAGNVFDFDGKGSSTFVGVADAPAAGGGTGGGTGAGGGTGGGSVPVPASALFVLMGLAGIGAASRRKKAKA